MTTVQLTCHCNFKKVEDVNNTVEKVFKMFSSHLVKSDSPISTNSDIECIYLYKNLSIDNLRVFKKLASNNKSLISLKNISILEGDDVSEGSDSENSESESEGEPDFSKMNYSSSDDEDNRVGVKEDELLEIMKDMSKLSERINRYRSNKQVN